MGKHPPPTSSEREPLPSPLTTALIILQTLAESILTTAETSLDAYISPSRRTAITSRATSFAKARPYLTTFLLAHVLCSGLPVVLFAVQVISVLLFSLATALVVGVLCAVAFTAACVGFASLVFVPVLVGTGVMGCAVWFWGWVGWYGLRWAGVVRGEGGDLQPVVLHRGRRDAVKEEGDDYDGGA